MNAIIPELQQAAWDLIFKRVAIDMGYGFSALGRGVSVPSGAFTKKNLVRTFADELEDEEPSCITETDAKQRTATRLYR